MNILRETLLASSTFSYHGQTSYTQLHIRNVSTKPTHKRLISTLLARNYVQIMLPSLICMRR